MRTTRPGSGPPSSPGFAAAIFLVALFAAALTLRPQLTAVGPLLPNIQADLGVPFFVVGLLGTIPVVCMGVFAPLTPVVAGWLGPRRAVTICLFMLGVAGLVRAAAPGAFLLLVPTVVVGVAMGLGGALLPVAVKNRLPERPLLGSGVYVAGIQLGAAVAAFVAVPLAGMYGGWRGSLAIISVVSVGLGTVWWALRRGQPEIRQRTGTPRPPWRSGLGWTLAATLGLISANYHGFMAWLPAYLVEHGWDESAAGSALAMVSVMALASTIALPLVAERRGSRRAYLMTMSTMLAVGLAGLLIRPDAGWVWVSLIGLAYGVLFLVLMVLPLDVADRPDAVGAIVGLVLGGGFLIAAPAPTLLGAARDVTGSFRLSMWLLVGIAVALMALSSSLSPRRIDAGVIVGRRHDARD